MLLYGRACGSGRAAKLLLVVLVVPVLLRVSGSRRWARVGSFVCHLGEGKMRFGVMLSRRASSPVERHDRFIAIDRPRAGRPSHSIPL